MHYLQAVAFNVFLVLIVFNGPVVSGETKLDGPFVKLPQGLVQGVHKKSYRNRTFSSFAGIPYAKPPVGNLRFKEPQPASGWNGTLQANRNYECLQFMPFAALYGPRGTEDCLYVYVHVPRETINPNENLDVVVHIHGGGFMLGAPKYMAGPEFLMDRDVVVVSMNYRLGILGFMSTEDTIVPGNNGLKDQSMALAWIKDNIKYFGGNPASVTITGLSAGAASVHLHYFSSLSRGLFHRGFSQSGTVLQCWSLAENGLDKAKTVAKNVSCPTSSTQEMVDCLRTVEPDKLMYGIRPVFVYMDAIPFSPFAPVVEAVSEGAFLSEHPYRLLEQGDLYDVPWITSNTKDEGLFPVGILVAYKVLKEFDDKWYDIMQYALELHYTVEPALQKTVLSKIREFYLKGKAITEENVEDLTAVFTDRMFLIDAEKSVRMQANVTTSNVYYYMFSYFVDLIHFPLGSPKGAVHGDDGRLIFKTILSPSKLSINDEKLMEIFIDLITSFATTGVPTVKSVEWLPVKRGGFEIDYLHIDGPDTIQMESGDRLASNDFWDTLPIREGKNALTGFSTK